MLCGREEDRRWYARVTVRVSVKKERCSEENGGESAVSASVFGEKKSGMVCVFVGVELRPTLEKKESERVGCAAMPAFGSIGSVFVSTVCEKALSCDGTCGGGGGGL